MQKIYQDGDNWIHLSKDLCLISNTKNDNFKYECMQHIPLFTKNYFPKLGDVVFDVGSWNGVELPIWSKAVGSSGHVYAIEADPKFYNQSLKVVELLGLKNVTCINAALMDSVGKIKIRVFSDNGLETTVHKEASPWMTTKQSREIFVPATTMDKIISDYKISHIDYVKMNIEGAEEFAIQGLKDFSMVSNWCISTHDFCGIPTKDFMLNFLTNKKLTIDTHEEVPEMPAMGGYLYVTPTKD
jgi:FkbM family methyltransferase